MVFKRMTNSRCCSVWVALASTASFHSPACEAWSTLACKHDRAGDFAVVTLACRIRAASHASPPVAPG
eukprot:1286526-Alexandrium_andersonii.AAC.1